MNQVSYLALSASEQLACIVCRTGMSFEKLQVLALDDESVANLQRIVPSLCESYLLAI